MRGLFLLLAAGVAAFGQSDANTITITASRTVPAHYDNATVQVQFSLPPTSTLDDALTIVKPIGFTAADFTDVSSPTVVPNAWFAPSLQIPFYWTFSKTISAEDVPSTLAVLESVRKGRPTNAGNDIVYSVSNAAPPAPACVYPALIGDAQAQAAKVADADGLKVGGIVSLAQGIQPQLVTIPVLRSGDFSTIFDPATGVGSVSFLPGPISAVAPSRTCSITVQFRLFQ